MDENGKETLDPAKVKALLPFGGHKGYGLALIDELYSAYTGGSLPTLRCRPQLGPAEEKRAPTFYFQCIKPDALDVGRHALGRNQAQNVKAVLADVLGHGNVPGAMLPGELEHRAAMRSEKAGGLIFTDAEVAELAKISKEAHVRFNPDKLQAAPA